MTQKKSKHECTEERRRYETPVFEEERGMNFTKQIWQEFNDNKWCFGCTNCNCN